MGLSLGHIARITFAVILLLIIAFVYLPHLFYTYSITAIVSAPVISITSPIEGVLKEGPPVMGTEVKAGETVGVVENLRFDRWRLDDMSTELKGVQERIVYMQQEANKIEETKSRLLSSFNNYSQSVEERLKIEIKRAKEALRERADTISESKAEYLRKSKLYAKGVVAENQADSAFF